jgi:hypothetical protein
MVLQLAFGTEPVIHVMAMLPPARLEKVVRKPSELIS